MKVFNKIRRIFDISLWKYQINGLIANLHQIRNCPACHSTSARQVDSKGAHRLYECVGCLLLYRFPREESDAMDDFYQTVMQNQG